MIAEILSFIIKAYSISFPCISLVHNPPMLLICCEISFYPAPNSLESSKASFSYSRASSNLYSLTRVSEIESLIYTILGLSFPISSITI
jgi:hypothetical protein